MNMIRQLAEKHFGCVCRLNHSYTDTEVVLNVYTDVPRLEFNQAKKEFRKQLRDLGFVHLLSNLSIIRG